ncbi:MAG: S1 RNA-binding domain-containing protein [Armatimonadetes bacterium]|nr:S1 RNA-binding domain-containing protein [Armatimonadota bacterium]
MASKEPQRDDLSVDSHGVKDEASQETAMTFQPRHRSGQSLGEAAAPRDLVKGDIVEGIVAAVTDEGVHVDVGAKYEGLIPRAEFASQEELPKRDERIEVAVMHVDEENGVIRLSKKKADIERIWRRLEEAAQTGEPVAGMVTERVTGGLRVDVGVPGFVPASQVDIRSPRNLDRFVGRELRLKVLEVDRKSKKVILSHKQLVEEERAKRRAETLSRLYEGAVVEGRVRSITDYGAFIDLGGVDGLLHVSEMSWVRVQHPSELLKVGDRVKVMVSAIEDGGERISLSRREVLPDPWKMIGDRIKPGQTVKAVITRTARVGAFARLVGIEGLELEGFIPLRELADRSVSDPREVVQPGQKVDAKVLDIHPEARKMTLSIAEVEQEKEREEYREIMRSKAGEEPRRTLGAALAAAGIVPQGEVQEAPPSGQDEAEPEPEAAEPAPAASAGPSPEPAEDTTT